MLFGERLDLFNFFNCGGGAVADSVPKGHMAVVLKGSGGNFGINHGRCFLLIPANR